MPAAPGTAASPRRRTLAGGRLALLAATAGLLTLPGAAVGQRTATGAPLSAPWIRMLPFTPGEELVFRADIGPFRGAGRALMRITGTERVDGHATYPLHFALNARVGLVKVEDNACSWLDPISMTARRYHKQERHPLSARTERVDLFPELGTLRSADGITEPAAAADPLDELSFLYYVRTLPLLAGDRHSFSRHFDAARNPTEVRVVGRERITVPAGTFDAIVVELRVRDPARFRGGNLIRMHLSDDARRLPVRIETAFRLAGSAVLVLESAGQNGTAGSCGD